MFFNGASFGYFAENVPVAVHPSNNSGFSIVPTSNTTTEQLEFGIALITINEILDSEVVQSVDLRNISFIQNFYPYSNTTTNITTTSLFQTLSNGANLTLNVTLFDSLFTLSFATQSLSLSPHTVKLTIQLSSWPFTNRKSSLAFVLSAAVNASGAQVATSPLSQSGISWVSVGSGSSTLYQQLLGVSLVDGFPRSIVNELQTTTNYIVITVPSFWKEVVVDPNYSVLLGGSKGPGGGGGGGSNSNSVIYIAVGVVVGVVAVAVVGGYAFRYYFQKRHEIKIFKKEWRARTVTPLGTESKPHY